MRRIAARRKPARSGERGHILLPFLDLLAARRDRLEPDDETASVDGKTILFNTGDMEVAHMMAHTNKYPDYHLFSFSHTDLEPVSGAGSPIKLDIVIDYNGGDGWDTLKLPDQDPL